FHKFACFVRFGFVPRIRMLTVEKRRTRQREFRGPEPNSVGILGRTPGSGGGDWIIQQSREEAARRAERDAEVRAQALMDMRSDWEQQTNKRLQRKAVNRRLQEYRRQMEMRIEERRDRLRALLEADERRHLEEMDASQETVLERQAKMRERAKQLREEKEAERQQLVEQKMNELWREQSEELRTNLQKRHLAEVIAERDNQVHLKKRLEAQRQAEERYFHELWKDELAAKAEREERDLAERKQREMETVAVLEQQRAAFKARRDEELKLKEEEAQLVREMEELRKVEAAQAAEERRRKEQETRRMLDRNIRLRMRQKAREAQEELAFDMKILEQLAEESRVEEANTRARKLAMREEDRRYREYLRNMMEEEKAREAELERLLDAEIQQQWQKRVDQWRREKEARRQLLEQVMAERRTQIQERLLANERRQREAAEEKAEILARIEAMKVEEREEAAARHQKNLNFGEELKAQINFNEHLRQLQEEERRQEEERLRQERERELERLRAAANMEWIDPKMHPMRKAWIASGKSLY
ncbi:hypothetical protein BOX15_Mlig024162g1, partial [Macrostomum lignano]